MVLSTIIFADMNTSHEIRENSYRDIMCPIKIVFTFAKNEGRGRVVGYKRNHISLMGDQFLEINH